MHVAGCSTFVGGSLVRGGSNVRTHGAVPQRNGDADGIKGQGDFGRCLVPQDPMENGRPKQGLSRIDANHIKRRLMGKNRTSLLHADRG